jgi:glycosyltransferase involved in cell wall biosynthesis
MIEAAPHPPSPTTAATRRPRIALAHDWLCGYRGGEAVLDRIAALVDHYFEPAALYVMFDDGRPLSPTIDRWRAADRIRTSRLNRLPEGPGRLRRWLLPFYPSAVAELGGVLAGDHRGRPIDLLISSSSAAVKGLTPPPGVPHLCYCHSPARYIWSRRDDYGGRSPLAQLRSAGLRLYANHFKRWDLAKTRTVTRFLANSAYTASQIRDCFGADAAVVHPPVRTDYFTPGPSTPREDFWLVVSALEPYKRIDLAIDAARLANKRLVIAGSGSQRTALERRAGPTVRFAGRVGDAELLSLYRQASVLLFPQIEDFGIVAAEAQACGLPVAARAAGGALDIIQAGSTGSLFLEPTPQSLARAAQEATRCDPAACRAAAARFAESVFDSAILAQIRSLLAAPARSA